MQMEEDEVPLDSSVSGAPTKMAITPEKHNLKVRRRNVVDTVNFTPKQDKGPDSESDVPLLRMSDSATAWHDEIIPRIPDLARWSAKEKGALIRDDNSSLLEDDSGGGETLTNREQIKISIIRGCIVNPDLTLGELRLLGCSSEGLVNGISLFRQHKYYRR